MRYDAKQFTKEDVKRLQDRYGKSISVMLMTEPCAVIDGKEMSAFTQSYRGNDVIDHIINEIDGVPIIGKTIRVGLFCSFAEFNKARYCLDITQ